MDPSYDVFVSYSWTDRDAVQVLVQALRGRGLRVFVDDPEIDDFARITTTIAHSLAASKVLLAYYSAAYPTRRACQWELTAAYLAAQRAGDPAGRILVVNAEPSPDHLYPGELRDALFRRAPGPDDPEALAELADAVAAHVGRIDGALGAIAPLIPPRWLPVQAVGSSRFVGRLADMWRLHAALHPEVTRVTVGRTGPGVAQLRGLGGIGKSLLAEEYALRFGAAYPGGVFWLRAYGSHEQAELAPEQLDARRDDELRRLALALGLTVEGRDPGELPGLLATAIEQRGQACLWVVDDLPNALNAVQVRSWLAPHPLAFTLLTTRSQAYGALATSVDLGVLDAEDAYQLLTTRRPPAGEDEARAAQGIVTALGGHALAVDVAGAALRHQQGLVSYEDFLAGLADPEKDELELAVELADALPTDHQASIARTLLRSINQLGQEGRDFLRLAAALAPEPIPATLVARIFEQVDSLDERSARRRAGQAVEQAASLSLATQTTAEDEQEGWVVHALVARTVRFREPAPERRTALRHAAIGGLAVAFGPEADARAYPRLRGLIPHARELIRRADRDADHVLLGWVARYDRERGEFRSAEALFRQQLEIRRRVLGEDYRTFTAMSELALTLHQLGELDAARQLHEQALDGLRLRLSPDDLNILIATSNLAETLRSLGDLDSARQLQQETLEGLRRVQGDDHPYTLGAMNNLAMTLDAMGELDAARQLHEQTLAASRRVLGDDHPDTLTSMSNLAETLRELGELDAARQLHEEALDGLRTVLGPDHPNTLGSMNNLALTLRALGEPDAARQLLEQVVDALRRLLGPDHPRTQSAMANLASV